MNCNPTLTADEFKTIHNGLCDLDWAIRGLEDVLNPQLFERLSKAASEIRSGMDGAYRQDREEGDRKSDHYRDVGQQLGMDQSVWSVYEVDNLSDPHPYPGVERVVYGNHWGNKPVSCTVNGSTWAALWIAANACVRDSGDTHHIFVEGFELKNGNELHLVTGS